MKITIESIDDRNFKVEINKGSGVSRLNNVHPTAKELIQIKSLYETIINNHIKKSQQ